MGLDGWLSKVVGCLRAPSVLINTSKDPGRKKQKVIRIRLDRKNRRIMKQLWLMELEFVDSQARSGPEDFILLNVVSLCEFLIQFCTLRFWRRGRMKRKHR